MYIRTKNIYIFFLTETCLIMNLITEIDTDRK